LSKSGEFPFSSKVFAPSSLKFSTVLSRSNSS
jgi:hypothetical protein